MKRLEVGPAELGVLAGMLRRMDFFAPLTVGQLDRVLPHVMLCRCETGETVFRKGSPGDAFYVVYQGKVAVKLPRLLVLSRTVATLGPGEFFGESALLSAEPRNATVTALEPTLLFTLIAEDFQFVLSENPAAAEEMRRIAAQRKFVSAHAT
ncbi:MAG: cyclic nucleotide-binding domain-containing protein [Elusimicrobia bacterium]|nr:cyclic nucleotide-binding domain-containing protein [Elusimicrobiota bacterium]